MSDEFETPRVAPRLSVKLPARLHNGESVVDVETVNMSETGLLVSGEGVAAGDRIDVEIDLPEVGWRRLAAEVVRTDPSATQLAARFADAASSGDREAIGAFLTKYLS